MLTKLKRNFIYQLHLLRLPGMSRTFGTRSKKLYQQGKGHYFCDESEFENKAKMKPSLLLHVDLCLPGE